MEMDLLISHVYAITKKIKSQPEFSELLTNIPELKGRTPFDTLMAVPEITLVEYPELFMLRQEFKELYKSSLKNNKINIFNNYSKEIKLNSIQQENFNDLEINEFVNQFETVVEKIPDLYKKSIDSFSIVLSKKELKSAIARGLNSNLDMIIKYDKNATNVVSEIFHEIGHLLEVFNPKLKKVSHDFLKERIYSNELVKLNKFSDDHELDVFTEESLDIYPGPFVSPYVGKTYGKLDDFESNTEVISIGLQLIYLDPLNFLFKDIEHFLIIYKLLREEL